MPYVITTSAAAGSAKFYPPPIAPVPTSRRAVATWMEAEHDVELLIEDHGGSIDEWPDVPEEGGTVGPLPDGTVIAVERVGWEELRLLLDAPPSSRHWRPTTIITAFNTTTNEETTS